MSDLIAKARKLTGILVVAASRAALRHWQAVVLFSTEQGARAIGTTVAVEIHS